MTEPLTEEQKCGIEKAVIIEKFAAMCRINRQDPKEAVRYWMAIPDYRITVDNAKDYGFKTVEKFQDTICAYAVRYF